MKRYGTLFYFYINNSASSSINCITEKPIISPLSTFMICCQQNQHLIILTRVKDVILAEEEV